MLKTQEHYDLIAQFDREFKGRRLDKEPKDIWTRGRVYQDGQLNDLFLAYRLGYALGKAIYATPGAAPPCVACDSVVVAGESLRHAPGCIRSGPPDEK